MKWTIIIVIMMSFIGSMMWMMPSPRERFQAKLRLHARSLGYNVQLARLTTPRAAGEVEPEIITVPAYRLMRSNMDRKESEALVPWQVHRVTSIASDGLPDGWSWAQGENLLDESQLAQIAEVLAVLPEGAVALESTPVQVSVYWHERGDMETLDLLKTQLQRIMDARF